MKKCCKKIIQIKDGYIITICKKCGKVLSVKPLEKADKKEEKTQILYD